MIRGAVHAGRPAVGLLLVALLFAGCGKESPRAAPPSAAPPTVVIRVPAIPRTIDPARARTAAERLVAQATQTPLLTYERRAEVGAVRLTPALAAALPTLSSDAREYRFQLRTGLLYADGRLVKASDVERGIAEATRTASPAIRAALASIVGAPAAGPTLRGVRSDDRTGILVVRLRRPDGRVPLALADPATSPVAALPRTDPGAATGALRVVRQGPDRTELAANSLRPTLDAVPAARVARIVLVGPSAGERADLTLAPAETAADDAQLVTAPALALTSAYLASSGALASRAARRALARAVDRRELAPLTPQCTVLPSTVAGGDVATPCPEPPVRDARPLAGVSVRIAVAPSERPGAAPIRQAIRALGGRSTVSEVARPLDALTSRAADVAIAQVQSALPHPAAWLAPAEPLDLLLAREVPRTTARPLTGAGRRWASLAGRARDRAVVIPLSAGRQVVRIDLRLDPRSVRLHPVLGLDLSALRLPPSRG